MMEFRQLSAARRRLSRKILEEKNDGFRNYGCKRFFGSTNRFEESEALQSIGHGQNVEQELIAVPTAFVGSFYRRGFPVAEGLRDAKESFGMGFRLMSTQTRILSQAPPATSTARYEEEENEENNKPKKSEPSPEECDQAVEGLSSVKARVKQALESKKTSALRRLWNALLGVGPALRAVASMSRQDWANKLGEWKKHAWEALKHYWVGTKLLWVDIRISTRLLMKLARGKNLTRRERQQLTRTAADIFRLVPMAVFIIVPFMEFLLPVFLKLFPNMLPSTFQDKMKEQEAMKKRISVRIEYAKFLQDTVAEMAKEIKTTRTGDVRRTAEDLDEFMNKVRTGGKVTNEEILAFGKLFNDELTLDNISRPRLISMCKYMGIQPYGTDAYLRYSLRNKLAWIKADDKLIQSEGIDSLSESELRAACRERGMLGLVSTEELKQQLKDWLDLSLNHSMPSSLLILSRAFLSGKLKPEDAVQATLSSLPDEVFESVGATVLPSDDTLEERRRKLEYIQLQEELIKEEEKDEQGRLKKEEAAVPLEEVKEMRVQAAKEAQELVRQKSIEQHDELCKLSAALAVLASSSSVSKERADFLGLVNREIKLYNTMVEKEGSEAALDAFQTAREESDRGADRAAGTSAMLIDKVDAILHKLEKELDEVDEKIGDRWRILDRDYDGKVTPEEVAAATVFLKDSLGHEPVRELISKLAKDKDGKILVEDIVKLGTAANSVDTDDPSRKDVES